MIDSTTEMPRSEEVQPAVAVLIPCFNEALTIAGVIRDFRQHLPEATIYVFDNSSTDETRRIAAEEGARIGFEPRRGKGYVVQTMFRSIDADIYLMVDGDSTYPATAARAVIEPIRTGEADMVIGSRLHADSESSFRIANRLGNQFYLVLIRVLFGVTITDLLSGYRAFNRALVEGVPLFGGGFETETELTIKAIQRGFRVVEVPVNLTDRPAGSHSKIRIVRDGVVILNTILTLLRDYKPLTFFGSIGLAALASGACVVLLSWDDPGRTAGSPIGYVFSLAGLLSIGVGLILHTVARHFQELDHQMQVFRRHLRLDADESHRQDRANAPGEAKQKRG